MAASTVPFSRLVRKLIPTIPDTELSRLIKEGYSLASAEPQILDRIDRDRDAAALMKKAERIEDLDWLEARGQTPLELASENSDAADRELATGRPRMPALAVLLFMLIRGNFGGFKDKKTATLLAESKTLEICLAELGMTFPGASTLTAPKKYQATGHSVNNRSGIRPASKTIKTNTCCQRLIAGGK